VILLLNRLPKATVETLIENVHNNLAFLIISMEQETMNNEKLNKWKVLLAVMDFLYKSNKQVKRVEKSEFVNDTCSTEIDLSRAAKHWFENNKNKNNKQNVFTALNYPWLFSLVSKVDILNIESKLSQAGEQLSMLQGGFNLNNLLNMSNFYLNIKVRRSHIIGNFFFLKKPR
jgi:hypothetical protein